MNRDQLVEKLRKEFVDDIAAKFDEVIASSSDAQLSALYEAVVVEEKEKAAKKADVGDSALLDLVMQRARDYKKK